MNTITSNGFSFDVPKEDKPEVRKGEGTTPMCAYRKSYTDMVSDAIAYASVYARK